MFLNANIRFKTVDEPPYGLPTCMDLVDWCQAQPSMVLLLKVILMAPVRSMRTEWMTESQSGQTPQQKTFDGLRVDHQSSKVHPKVSSLGSSFQIPNPELPSSSVDSLVCPT